MSSQLCISVTFLSPYFHGRRDDNMPEWPPSPLRLFQSLVAAVAAGRRLDRSRPALRWLEALPAPRIVAPTGEIGGGYRLSVPNNSMDVVNRAWARGNDLGQGDANPATHRTMKTVRYVRLIDQGDFPVAHYLWQLPSHLPTEMVDHLDTLSTASKTAVTLGWGLDLIAGHGRVISTEESNLLQGERWEAIAHNQAVPLRVPVSGTLDALERRHHFWLNRLVDSGTTFVPTAPLSTFEITGYARSVEQTALPFAAFSLRNPDSGNLRAFTAIHQVPVVSGMARHATKLAAQRSGWPQSKVNEFVLGHGEPRGAPSHVTVGAARFAYLPLPSIEIRKDGGAPVVGDIRRLILFSFATNHDNEIAWAGRTLSGQDLICEDTAAPPTILTPTPKSDSVVQRYTQRATTWATVTPVVLPGHDDPAHYRRRLGRTTSEEEQARLLAKLDDRIDRLLRRAMVQSGISMSLAAHADIQCRRVGFWRGTERADHYRVPAHLRQYARVHVRVQWRDEKGEPIEVPGPICFGGGRFYGIGLFAAL